MSRLPLPGADEGNWGSVLNDYLLVSHDATGLILPNAVSEAQLNPAVRTKLNATTGPTGPQGPAGPANLLTIGTVVSAVTPSATITGTAPNQTLNLVLAKGDPGPAGSNDWNDIINQPTIPVITASTTAPSSPAIGDMWVDLSS